MTSAQSMKPGGVFRRFTRGPLPAIIAVLALAGAGCSSDQKLTDPVKLRSPFEQPQVWAVAPFANESGVSSVQTDQVADRFVEEVEGIEGIRAVPVNRVLAAMRQLQLRAITSPGDALAVMNALGVDGIIVGTVTAFDPYPPQKFGAAIQLHRRDAQRMAALNPVELTRAPTEKPSLGALPDRAPFAQASGVFDAKDNQTLKNLAVYANGRTEPGSPYGSRIYLVNMDLYTQFVAHELLSDLLGTEWTNRQDQAKPEEKR